MIIIRISMFNYHKRINKELENINANIISSTIKKKFRYNNDIIDIEFSNNYPFEPPNKIYINYKLLDYNYNMDNDVQYIVENYYNIRCFCCKSLMCANNWKPSNKITDILEENNKNIELIEKIKKLLLIIDLSKNKLPTDVYTLLLDYM